MTTIGNVGIGLLILIILWIFTLIVFVIGVKLQSNISWITLGSATAISITFLIIPIDKGSPPLKTTEIIEKDYTIIYKYCILGFLWLSALIGLGFFFVLHFIEPLRPKPIKSFHFD